MNPRPILALVLLALLLLPGGLQAQSRPVYRLSTSGDLATLGAGLGIAVTGHLLGARVYKLDPGYFDGLDASEVNAFDRPATRLWSPAADRLSHATMLGTGFLSAGAMLVDRPARREWSPWLVMAVETFLITDGGTFTVKSLSRRLRPYAYNPAAPLEEKVKKHTWESFFSGHSSFTTAVSFFAAKIYHDHHPGSRWRIAVWGGAGLCAATTAFLRVWAGQHFPTDVLAGLAFGALTGVLVPEIHRVKKSGEDRKGAHLELGPAWGMGGLRLGLRF